MDDMVRDIFQSIQGDAAFHGWVGLNMPGLLEEKSGLWILKSGARHYGRGGFKYDPGLNTRHFEWGGLFQGEMSLECGGVRTMLKTGMFYLMPEHVRLTVHGTDDALLTWIEFQGPLAEDVFRQLGGESNRIVTGSYSYGQIKSVLKAAHVLQFHAPNYQLTAHSLLWRFIAASFNSAPMASDRMSKPIRDAVSYIHQTALQRNISVSELSERSMLSTETFRKRFQEEVGEPPIHYMLHYRVTRAKEMLEDTSLTIKNIAFETGFSDPYYFSRIFKQYEGVSPLRFRREVFPELSQE